MAIRSQGRVSLEVGAVSGLYFGSVSVPGSAAKHPRVLVLVAQGSECQLLLETLVGAGLVASGLSHVDLGRQVLRSMCFDVVVVDREMARSFWGPLMVLVAEQRTRVVLLTAEDVAGTIAPTVEGVQTIARPLTIQQLLGAIRGAVATHPRLVETQPELLAVGSASSA